MKGLLVVIFLLVGCVGFYENPAYEDNAKIKISSDANVRAYFVDGEKQENKVACASSWPATETVWIDQLLNEKEDRKIEFELRKDRAAYILMSSHRSGEYCMQALRLIPKANSVYELTWIVDPSRCGFYGFAKVNSVSTHLEDLGELVPNRSDCNK